MSSTNILIIMLMGEFGGGAALDAGTGLLLRERHR